MSIKITGRDLSIDKLYQVIERNQIMKHHQIRIIVGSKIIRKEIMNELDALKRGKAIFDFGVDGKNSGAFLIRMRNFL